MERKGRRGGSIEFCIFVACAARKLSRTTTSRFISRAVIHLAPSNVPYHIFRHFLPLRPSSSSSPPRQFLSADAAFIRTKKKRERKKILDKRKKRNCAFVRFEIRRLILPRVIFETDRIKEGVEGWTKRSRGDGICDPRLER